jgi:hypothetical protein
LARSIVATGSSGDDLPAIAPVWSGRFLDFEDALGRFGVPAVVCIVVGLPNGLHRRALVAAVRAQPPFGLIGEDADLRVMPDGLPLTTFILPGALIRSDGPRRRFDPSIGVDLLGFNDESEREAFMMVAQGVLEDQFGDEFPDLLLRYLTPWVARSVEPATHADGHDALIHHAQELLGLGAVGAAGVVAGVAFERLMRAALLDADSSWLADYEAKGKHPPLAQVIDKVVKGRSLQERRARLDGYRLLRNDLAHRLGEEVQTVRSDEELFEAVDELVKWLARQDGENEVAELVDVDLPPSLSYEELHDAASAAGSAAADAEQPVAMNVGKERIEEGAFGVAWVLVHDSPSGLARWLLEEGHAKSNMSHGVLLFSPQLHFQRALAWSWGYARRLRDAGIAADYGGRLT